MIQTPPLNPGSAGPAFPGKFTAYFCEYPFFSKAI